MTDIRDALPEGIELDDKLFSQERFIHASIDNAVVAIRDAGILVFIVLALFLMNSDSSEICPRNNCKGANQLYKEFGDNEGVN